MTNLIGHSLGRYHILEQLGEGGMAVVYKAYDTRLERDVAIKIIRGDVFGSAVLNRIYKRFEREARALAKLSHPNIVKILEYGEHEGMPYLVMEYLPGGTLKQRSKAALPWREAFELLIPIAQALDYAHEHYIIHRDIKPSNILLTEKGQPMLTDFGIAKMLEIEETATLTGTGVGLGTPEYMAPEQGRGITDERSDIYSLGIMLYELVTGRKPFVADTPLAVVLMHASNTLPAPRQYVPKLPVEVERIIIKALEKKPENRYQKMADLVRALRSLILMQEKEERKLDERRNIEESRRRKQEEKQRLREFQKQQRLEVRKQKASGKKIPTRMLIAGIAGLLVMSTVGWMGFSGVFGNVAQPTAVGEVSTVIQSAVSTSPPATTASTTRKVPPTPTTPTLTIGSTYTRSKDGMVMLYVPEGDFTMGAAKSYTDESPPHAVYLDAFWIDKTEVSGTMYMKCVDAGLCPPYSEQAPEQTGDHAADYISWSAANDYCTWVEGRLPTEAEWEKAARGGLEGKKYPWGDDPPVCVPDAANGALFSSCTGSHHYSVSAFQENGYGIRGMAGGMWEWVSDWYDASYYTNSPKNNPTGPMEGTMRVLRGGSWSDPAENLRVAIRNRGYPDQANGDLGFRCAQSANAGASTGTASPAPVAATQPAATTESISSQVEITDDKGISMRLVPAGEFSMGSQNGDPDERPVHTVYIDAFYIDKYEVTNVLYEACVNAGACEAPRLTHSSTRANYYGNSDFDNYPVVFVNWNKAKAYCQWRGANLPTEAQWEKAARGTDGRTYPWGEGIDCDKANIVNCVGNTTEVGSYENGKSPYDVYDMAGNVWEWVNDWYGETYYENSPPSNPLGPVSGLYRVPRDGAWLLNGNVARSANRNRFPPTYDSDGGGFRCARDIIP